MQTGKITQIYQHFKCINLSFFNRFKIILLILSGTLLSGCSNSSVPPDPKPKHDTFKIESKIVDETRTITVWTPPEYANSESDFPVLYMPDGGINEDFPHIANTLSKLVDNNSIPPILLVGIENTKRRRDLTGPSEVAKDGEIAPLSDGSSNFRTFINDELFAEIDRRYRTTDERGIIGESAAGLFVVETLLLKPDMFDFYIAMDPALYWNDRYLVRTAPEHLAKFNKKAIRFWFAGSSAKDIFPHTQALSNILEKQSPSSLSWKYLDKPDEKHNTIFRSTKEGAVKWILDSKNKSH